MEATTSPLFFCGLLFVFLLMNKSTTADQTHVKGNIIGAILDTSSRIGKEDKVAMEMAIEDSYNQTNVNLTLQVWNSRGEPIQSAFAAAHLINQRHARAILGPRSWEEASLVSEIGTHSHIPILSLSDTTPIWATSKWPFLIQSTPQTQHSQTKAVAAIVKSFGWHRIVVIYEDTDSTANGFIPYLHDSLQEIGAEISTLIEIPPFETYSSSNSSLSDELKRVKTGQCRVIVVHASLQCALQLFDKTKKMGMMEQGYVWITTDKTTSLVHSLNRSAISSMQGVIGIKSYFPETGHRFDAFYSRFTRKFWSEFPEERNHEPGIFALQAYDATMVVAKAMAKGDKKGLDLLHEITSSQLEDGLSTSEVKFTGRRIAAQTTTFHIINVIGKSYKDIGFWTDGLGFSRNIHAASATQYTDSMENLRQVVWPGEPRRMPKGWTLPTSGKTLRIAVPNGTLFNVFLTVDYDELTMNYTFGGYGLEVFKSTVALLPYALPYDLHHFDGTFDAMLDQVYNKTYDAAIGPIAITAERYKQVDFSQPHTDTALVMVVPVQSQLSNKAWMFLKPFTKAMWLLIALVNLYNGFVVWMIEREHCHELRGSVLNQLGTLLWLAFATLFSLKGAKLHSNLSRMATLVWLFVALVITQSYTANLTSMLTVSRLVPTVADIETLKYNNAKIGSYKKAFVSKYLTDVLNFSDCNMRNYTDPKEIAIALKNQEIAAAFLESPVAKLFLAKYCKSFIIAGPTYKVGGYGFAFQKGSLIISDINEALLHLIDNGKIRDLEKDVIATENCVEVESDPDVSLSPISFCVLFILSGGTSTVALLIYVILRRRRLEDSMHQHVTIWFLMFGILKFWLVNRNRFSRKVSHNSDQSSGSESPPNTREPWNRAV